MDVSREDFLGIARDAYSYEELPRAKYRHRSQISRFGIRSWPKFRRVDVVAMSITGSCFGTSSPPFYWP